MLFIFIIIVSLRSQSQNTQNLCSTVDSLCASRYSETGKDIISKRYEHTIKEFSIASDIRKPLERNYTTKRRQSSLSGWYPLAISSTSFLTPSSELPGIVFLKKDNISDAFYISTRKSGLIFFDGAACFFDGIPCCRWNYKTTSYFRSCPEEIRKTLADSLAVLTEVDFKDGLMHGEYIVSNFDRKKNSVTGVLYQTIFENSTGYYKDFFPDGTLRMEGAVKEGYADGLWRFYIYGGCDEYNGLILAEYKNGERLSQQEFFSKEEVDKQIREAIEKKETEKKQKRNIFSFLKKKKVRSIY